MSLLDFEKMPVKQRVVYAFISSVLTTSLFYFGNVVFELVESGWNYYLFFFIFMLVFGFFSSGYTFKKDK